MDKIKANYLYIKVLDIQINKNFLNYMNKQNNHSHKFLLNFSLRNMENNSQTKLNNEFIICDYKDQQYTLRESLNIVIYEKAISMLKEYLEISVVLDYNQSGRKENFVVLKNFSELKTSELVDEIWQIKNYDLHVLYEFRYNFLIESPKKPMKNRIPIPSVDPHKKKISRHDSQILDCDSKSLKKISETRKLSECDDDESDKRERNNSIKKSFNDSQRGNSSFKMNKTEMNKDEKYSMGSENINIKSFDFKTNSNPFSNGKSAQDSVNKKSFNEVSNFIDCNENSLITMNPEVTKNLKENMVYFNEEFEDNKENNFLPKIKENDFNFSFKNKYDKVINTPNDPNEILVDDKVSLTLKDGAFSMPDVRNIFSHNTERKELSNLNVSEQMNYTLKNDSASEGGNIKFYDNRNISKRNSNKSMITINSSFAELNDGNRNKIKLTLNSQNLNTNQSNSQNNNTIMCTNQNILMNILEHEEIDTRNFNRLDYGDSYCEAFFLAGLGANKVKMIPDSDNFISPCKHKNCSILNAYRPEILEHFPSSNVDGIELNSTTASLCFPSGVKICYIDRENDLKALPTFSTILTNEAGEQRYLTIMHFYRRYDPLEFEQLYKFNPIKDYLKMTKNLELIENSKNDNQRKSMEKEIKKNLEICTNFINNQYIYLPYAMCLISKFPYIKQMEKSLDSLLRIYSDSNAQQKEINNLLIHVINEIPIPPINKKINFFLPYSLNQIELYSYLHKDLPYNSFSSCKIFDYFSSENFALIFFLILFEQKILFVCDNFNLLSEIMLSFISFIYPFEWVNILIPILSEELIRYLQCFRPFIMGIEDSMLEIAKNNIEDDQEVFFVFIKKDLVDLFIKKKFKKSSRKSVFADKDGLLPSLHEEVYNEFKKEISNLKISYEKNKKNKKNRNQEEGRIENKLKKTCIKIMAYIFGDYKKYLTQIDKLPIFNAKSFVGSKPQIYSKFYEELTNTHIFKYFLQISNEEQYPYFEKLCIRYSNQNNFSGPSSKESGRSKKSIFFVERKSNLTIDNIFSGRNARSSSQAVKNFKRESTKEKDKSNNYNYINSNNFAEVRQNNKTKGNKNTDIIMNDANYSNCGFGMDSMISKSPNVSALKVNPNENSALKNSDSNSYSNSKSENTDGNKNNLEPDNYLILPYFINCLLNSDISKIEFFINEKIKNLNNEDRKKIETKIIPYSEGKTLNVTCIPESIIRYKVNPNERNSLFGVNITGSKSLSSNGETIQQNKINLMLMSMDKKFQNVDCFDSNFLSNYPTEYEKRGSFGKESCEIEQSLKQVKLGNELIDNENPLLKSGNFYRDSNPLNNSISIRRSSRQVNKFESEARKEKITDFLRNIFSSEPMGAEDKKCFVELFANRSIRGHFAQLVFQEKFKLEKTHVINSNVFEDFYQMIFTALLNCDNNVSQFEIVRLLTKSTFYYYKLLENKQRYYIYQELSKKHGFFNCWSNEEFWTYWFNCEIKGKINTFSDWEEFYFTILIEISTKMKDLNISYKTIHFCLIEKIADKFLSKRNDLVKELEVITLKQQKNK